MSSRGGFKGASKRSRKKAWFKAGTMGGKGGSSLSTSDPAKIELSGLMVTTDQGKERICAREMMDWMDELIDELGINESVNDNNNNNNNDNNNNDDDDNDDKKDNNEDSSSSASSSSSSLPLPSHPKSSSISDDLAAELAALQEEDDFIPSKKSRNNDESSPSDPSSSSASSSSTPAARNRLLAVSPDITKVKGVVYLAFHRIPSCTISINTIYDKLFESIEKKRGGFTRFSIRCAPIIATCYSSMEQLEKLLKKYLPSAFESLEASRGGKKDGGYLIDLYRRGKNDAMPRDDVIKLVNRYIPNNYPNNYTVKLKNPDIIIIIEVIERFTAIGLIENKSNYCGLNIRKAQEKAISMGGDNNNNDNNNRLINRSEKRKPNTDNEIIANKIEKVGEDDMDEEKNEGDNDDDDQHAKKKSKTENNNNNNNNNSDVNADNNNNNNNNNDNNDSDNKNAVNKDAKS